MKADQERVKELLMETILLLCRNGLHFDRRMTVQGLLGITLDDKDIFMIHLNEVVVPDSRNAVADRCSVASEDSVTRSVAHGVVDRSAPPASDDDASSRLDRGGSSRRGIDLDYASSLVADDSSAVMPPSSRDPRPANGCPESPEESKDRVRVKSEPVDPLSDSDPGAVEFSRAGEFWMNGDGRRNGILVPTSNDLTEVPNPGLISASFFSSRGMDVEGAIYDGKGSHGDAEYINNERANVNFARRNAYSMFSGGSALRRSSARDGETQHMIIPDSNMSVLQQASSSKSDASGAATGHHGQSYHGSAPWQYRTGTGPHLYASRPHLYASRYRPKDSADKEYQCTYPGCSLAFYARRTLLRHQTQKHGRPKSYERYAARMRSLYSRSYYDAGADT